MEQLTTNAHSNKGKHGALFYILDILFNVVVIFVIVITIRTFLISPFQVEGSSMIDTLENNEYIIINKLVYFLHSPLRGDMVVFHPPNDPSKYYVKRVIGLPGDTITLRGGYMYVKTRGSSVEEKLEEAYLNTDNFSNTWPGVSEPTTEVRSFSVPDDHYFLLGDNRRGSHDSRSFRLQDGTPAPFVSQWNIKGRVWVVALPVSKIKAFEATEYHLTAPTE